MTSQTRLAMVGFTVETRLMVRETVAMETFAARAIVRMSMRSGTSALCFLLFAFFSTIGKVPTRAFRISQHEKMSCTLVRRVTKTLEYSLPDGRMGPVAFPIDRR